MIEHNPMQHFHRWFCEADQSFDEREPNAMWLTTIGQDGNPRNRMVLLKKYTWEGFIFYTNYNSEKAKAIAANSAVGMLFNWVNSHRRVQISGTALKLDESVSDAYFALRPRASQLGAWASRQSREVISRKALEFQFEDTVKKFNAAEEIQRPKFWGGYLVRPSSLVFTEKFETYTKTYKYHLINEYDWDLQINYNTNTF